MLTESSQHLWKPSKVLTLVLEITELLTVIQSVATLHGSRSNTARSSWRVGKSSQGGAVPREGGSSGPERSKAKPNVAVLLPVLALAWAFPHYFTGEGCPETHLQPAKPLLQPLGSSCLARGCCCYLFVQPQHHGHRASATRCARNGDIKT